MPTSTSSYLAFVSYLFLPHSPGLILLSLSFLYLPICLSYWLHSSFASHGLLILSPWLPGFLFTTWKDWSCITIDCQWLALKLHWHFKCQPWLSKAWYSPINRKLPPVLRTSPSQWNCRYNLSMFFCLWLTTFFYKILKA